MERASAFGQHFDLEGQVWQVSPVRHQEAGLSLTSERTTDPDDPEPNILDLTTDRELVEEQPLCILQQVLVRATSLRLRRLSSVRNGNALPNGGRELRPEPGFSSVGRDLAQPAQLGQRIVGIQSAPFAAVIRQVAIDD
jgi:hypothetical protein